MNNKGIKTLIRESLDGRDREVVSTTVRLPRYIIDQIDTLAKNERTTRTSVINTLLTYIIDNYS